MSGIVESWRIFRENVRPMRLIQEEPGVKGPLWFGRRPDSVWHVTANLLRLFCAIWLAPIWIFTPHAHRSIKDLIKRIVWGLEWANIPDAVLRESPWSLVPEKGKVKYPENGQYAVTGKKPRYLLKVTFEGGKIAFWKQSKYDWKREKPENGKGTLNYSCTGGNRSQLPDYTAISYAMDSAEILFFDLGGRLEPQPEIPPGGKRKQSLLNRKKIAWVVLSEYARARKPVNSGGKDVEYIWLDEFCISDEDITKEEDCEEQRKAELGQLADIFRNAKQVAVFCHVEGCDHTDVGCLWVNRLFTLAEILYTPRVLLMIRSKDQGTPRHIYRISVLSGRNFRAEMQTRAAERKEWHLYNIMQHATNSGAVPWPSAIHSLVVEAIRRDEASGFDQHEFLGKALNGLLPRRSDPLDLLGINGWADLAWLLELNQGYYNTTHLVALCRLADPSVPGYRWWGRLIAPKEGTERLEALATSIPVKLCRSKNSPAEPALSIIAPKSIPLTHWLQRDSSALYHRPEMEGLKRWMIGGAITLVLIGITSGSTGGDRVGGAITMIWLTAAAFAILELLVGTIFVKQDMWFVVEDHKIPGGNAHKWLRSQDPTFDRPEAEWGPRQLIPQWEPWSLKNNNAPMQPYAATLIDLQTGVWTKAAVTSRPNDMVVLAVHGSGITCMLLDREEREIRSTIAIKVGMVNLPPFVLAQSEDSGTVYVGGGATAPPKPPPKNSPYPISGGRRDLEDSGELQV